MFYLQPMRLTVALFVVQSLFPAAQPKELLFLHNIKEKQFMVRLKNSKKAVVTDYNLKAYVSVKNTVTFFSVSSNGIQM